MAEAAYRELAHEVGADPRVTEAKVFGMQALKFGGKVFAGLWEDALVVRLDPARCDELVEADRATRFDPMGGRPTKGWIVVPEGQDDWVALADEAKAFVATLVGD